jgi:tellurite resistance-related uncharacterized protein
MTEPYRITPVFDEYTLPAALRREHRTKSGVWGIIRVLQGQVRLVKSDSVSIVTVDQPGLVKPEEPHWVEPLGPIKMQVEFFDHAPSTKRDG